MSETYTINDLQALPDADLNALTVELRGLESVRCASGFGEIVESWLCDIRTRQPLYRADTWTPTDDRN